MGKPSVDDILQQGIHGAKEIKPEERRKFLGTLRERVLVALTKEQVYETGTIPEVAQLMKRYPDAHLLVNGNMAYEDFSKYLKIAGSQGVEYTIVTNKEHDSELGLVLACGYAVDKEEIYVKKKIEVIGTVPEKKGLFGKVKGWFKK